MGYLDSGYLAKFYVDEPDSGFTEIYTGDRHMTLAAPHFRVRALTMSRGSERSDRWT